MLGPPASGKTSIGNKLSTRPGVEVLRTGHLLRREIERGTALGERVRRAVEQGDLAPIESVIEVLTGALAGTQSAVLVFDGFPRSQAQIAPFLDLCRAEDIVLRAVVVLILGEEEVRHRLMGRRVCSKCGRAYHLDYDPPNVQGRCDQCGASLVQREDDHSERITRRLANYRELTVPVIEFFERDHADLTRRVPAEGSPEHVLVTVTDLLEEVEVLA